LEEPPESEAPDVKYGIVAATPEMKTVVSQIRKVANESEHVLIVAESGCGKELVARALHEQSTRRDEHYLALNCSTIPESVVEAELFGYEKGAFTGAAHEKAGAFESTSGGTLFLDEIGELPPGLQPKLLRVLESSSIRRVGGTREIKVDTRVVAATHRNLRDLVQEGKFRNDLFHRLFVLEIRIPPLRERPEDIRALARHFIRMKKPERKLELSREAEGVLVSHTWKGNARELRNVIVRAILDLPEGVDVIEASHLVFSDDETSGTTDSYRAFRALDRKDRHRILKALQDAKGNVSRAAKGLGLKRGALYRRLKRHKIK
jgi:transcriptional regulator with GAF, ATPase, and Fis domain